MIFAPITSTVIAEKCTLLFYVQICDQVAVFYMISFKIAIRMTADIYRVK